MKHQDILFRIRNRALPAIPKSLGRLPYAAALKLGKLLGQIQTQTPPQIWARNSYVTESFVPFLSDLDLTCWFNEIPTERDLSHLCRTLRFLKRVFPLLGETNFYFRPTSQIWANLINPVELNRDPDLRPLLGKLDRKPTASESTAALLRYLETDWHNLIRNPWIRAPKWEMHLGKLGFELPLLMRHCPRSRPHREDAISDILRQLVTLAVRPMRLGEIAENEAVDSALQVLNSRVSGVPLHILAAEETEISFFPHRFCFLQEFPEWVDRKMSQVLIHQLAWELWGLACQLPWRRESEQLSRHLRSIERLHFSVAQVYPTLSLLQEVRVGLTELLRAVEGESYLAQGKSQMQLAPGSS